MLGGIPSREVAGASYPLSDPSQRQTGKAKPHPVRRVWLLSTQRNPSKTTTTPHHVGSLLSDTTAPSTRTAGRHDMKK